jgi:hypothetical protein
MSADTKHCNICDTTKPTADFNKNARSKDGLQSECKACKATRYAAAKDSIRKRQQESWAKYAEANREKLLTKSKRYRAANRDAIAEKKAAYKAANPIKLAAKSAVHSHVLTGRLERKACEVCGASPTEAHHDDYSKPLDVRWLCKRHHRLWHIANGPGKNAAIEAAVWGEKT